MSLRTLELRIVVWMAQCVQHVVRRPFVARRLGWTNVNAWGGWHGANTIEWAASNRLKELNDG